MSAPAAAACRRGRTAVALAQRIAASKHLIFGGLQAYQGSAQHKRTPAERRTLIGAAVDGARRTVEQLRQQGLDCPIVGGAGTGTFEIEAGVRHLYRDPGRQLRVHGRRLRPQPGRGRRAGRHLPPCAVRAGHGDERAAHRASPCWMPGTRRWRSIPACRRSGSARTCVTPAPRTSTASWRSAAETADAETGREAAPGAGPLRPDGRPLRLVCRRAQRPGGVPVAGGGARRDELSADRRLFRTPCGRGKGTIELARKTHDGPLPLPQEEREVPGRLPAEASIAFLKRPDRAQEVDPTERRPQHV